MATTNGKGKKYAGITEPVATTEQLEELMEKAPEVLEPVGSEINNTTNNSTSTEELLKQAKAATKQQQPTVEKPSNVEETSNTATNALTTATAQAASDLVEASLQAQIARVEMGIREGLEDANDLRQGYQVGLLLGLTRAKVTDTNDLAEQLQVLRSHTGTANGDAIAKQLKNIQESGESAHIIQSLPKEEKTEKNRLKII